MNVSRSARHGRRGSLARNAGWMSAAAMLAVSAFAPATTSASTNWASVSGYLPGTADNDRYSELGDDCTKLIAHDDNMGSTYVLTSDYEVVVVKSGTEASAPGHVNTVFAHPSAGETVWADSNGSGKFDEGDRAIKHIILCLSPEESDGASHSHKPSQSTEPSQSADPSQSTEPSQSAEPSQSDEPSQSTEPSQSADPSQSTKPSDEVKGVQGTPRVTPPPTDTIAAAAAPTGESWRLVLIGIAAVLIASLTFSKPRTVRAKR